MQILFLDSKPISHLVKPPLSQLDTKTTEKVHLKIADLSSVGPMMCVCVSGLCVCVCARELFFCVLCAVVVVRRRRVMCFGCNFRC